MVKKVQASRVKALEEEAAKAAAPSEDPTAETGENGVEDIPDEVEKLVEETKEKLSSEKDVVPEKVAEDESGTDPADKKKVKANKKVIPSWASIDRSKIAQNNKLVSMEKPKILDKILEILKDEGGNVSISKLKSLLLDEYPNQTSNQLKKHYLRGVEKGVIKQVKGLGFSGSCKLGNPVTLSKKDKKKGSKKEAKVEKASLDSLFPLVFTWACNPKEASVGSIRKYLINHYPELSSEDDVKLKKALEHRENGGQLERLTGKGFCGTYQLVDEAKKIQGVWSDAIENAIIAMNEPKDLSVNALRDYLSVYHPEYNTDDKPTVLRNALERAAAKGWIQMISGKGFSGSYRLSYPFYPGPRELWGKDFVDPDEVDDEKKAKAKKEDKPKKSGNKRAASESDDEDDGPEEYVPSPKKRGAPSPRKTAAPPKKVAKKAAPKPVSKKVKGKGKKK